MKQNKGINIICCLFILVAVLDLISTLRLGELIALLEANPLYKFIGLTGICIINVLLVCIILWAYYKSTSVGLRYSIIASMVTITTVRFFVILANWQIGNSPPTLEQAQAITQEAKNYAIWLIALKTLFPYIISMVIFWLFRLDHDIHPKN